MTLTWHHWNSGSDHSDTVERSTNQTPDLPVTKRPWHLRDIIGIQVLIIPIRANDRPIKHRTCRWRRGHDTYVTSLEFRFWSFRYGRTIDQSNTGPAGDEEAMTLTWHHWNSGSDHSDTVERSTNQTPDLQVTKRPWHLRDITGIQVLIIPIRSNDWPIKHRTCRWRRGHDTYVTSLDFRFWSFRYVDYQIGAIYNTWRPKQIDQNLQNNAREVML